MKMRSGSWFFVLILVALFSFVSCGDDDSDGTPDGGDNDTTSQMGLSCQDEDQTEHCDSNAECKKLEYCGENRNCLSCKSCSTYRDCDSDNQEICDPDLGCCVPKNCSADTDCPEAQICSEGVCRDQCCNALADCEHDGSACLKKPGSTADVLGYCIIPECWEGSDCAETGYCNVQYECDNCTQNTQCEEGYNCDGGICVSEVADGDTSEEVYDCQTYNSSCIFEVMQPIIALQGLEWAACDKAAGETPGYQYSFAGTNDIWVRYFDNYNTHEFYKDGQLFVKIMVDTSAGGIMRYSDIDGNTIGWYGYSLATGVIRIRCPVDGEDPVEYNFDIEHINSCSGYAGPGIYVAPSDEGCPDISEM